jgi:predicted HAD superfamily Cof-like phosphohydrolase
LASRAFDAVHKSNMSKVQGGVVTYDADGKVMKNEEYKKVAKLALYDKLRELVDN